MAHIRPNLILGAAGIIVLAIVLSLAQEMNRRFEVQKQIRTLQTEANSMEKHIIELEQLNEYFSTSDYRERVAREQLNFRAEGEKVVLIPANTSLKEQTNGQQKEVRVQLSIPMKWWYAFFVDSKNI